MELKATIVATGLISACNIMNPITINQFSSTFNHNVAEQKRSHFVAQYTNDSPLINQTNPPMQGSTSDDNFKILISKLLEFISLKPGWDTEDSIPPSIDSIKQTLKFISKLSEFNFPYPQPMLSTEGQIGLFWDESNIFIDIEIEGENKITYFAKDSNGNKAGADDVDFSYEIPKDIIFFLKKINSSSSTDILEITTEKGWHLNRARSISSENYALV